MNGPWLRSTGTGIEYPFHRLEEYAENGESLEVCIPGIGSAKPVPGPDARTRFSAFMPFDRILPEISLGEGGTPLVDAGPVLKAHTGVDGLLLKNETMNPTWSFKDRGSVACTAMALGLGEASVATISTGNMGHSLAAYGARAGLRVVVFVPDFAPPEKVLAMAIHGADIVRVGGCEYTGMKRAALALAPRFGLRIVSGNGPVRAEGYKLEAFELWEQLGGSVPDLVVVPTSACGHIRGLFKGFRELVQARLAPRLPRMVVVQAAANSPLVSAIRAGSRRIVPFGKVSTIAEALTSGDPPGGEEILDKAIEFGWLAEDAEEDEILESQRLYARAGFFVEPGTATTLAAVRKLRSSGSIRDGERVVIMLTGSGLKDMGVMDRHGTRVVDCRLETLERSVEGILRRPQRF